jgi:putative ABC transport system permease protein
VPVVVVTPPNLGVATLATHPAQAAALARWGWPHAAPDSATLARLDPRLPAPLILTGGWVEVHLAGVVLQGGEPSDIDLDVVSADGTPGSYDLGALPLHATSVVLRQSIPCQLGCRWQGLTLVRGLTDSAPQYGSIDVAGLTMDRSKPMSSNGVVARTVDIGPAAAWHSGTPAGTAEAVQGLATGLTRKPVVASDRLPPNTLLVVQARGGPGFRLRYFSAGDPVSVLHGDVPVSVPALTTVASQGRTPLTTFDAARLDGGTHLFTSVGQVSAMPGVPGNAALADIDILARLADRPVNFASYQVWLADPSPANVARRSAALARLGVPVLGVRTIQARESALRDAGAPQSLRLGLISGAVGLLIALGVLLITTVTTLRSRRYDVAALRLSGVPPSLARTSLVGEGIALSVIGTVVGTACGILGGRLLLRAAPFLTGGSAFPAERTFTAWWVVVAVLLGTVALLVVLSWLIAVAVVHRAQPAIVREDFR